jgi:hypothetical protein
VDLSKNRFWLKKICEAPKDFRERTTFFLQLGTNTFGNIIFLGNFFINLLAAFLGMAPWCPPQHFLFMIAAAIAIK